MERVKNIQNWFKELIKDLSQGKDYERVVGELDNCQITTKYLQRKLAEFNDLLSDEQQKNKELLSEIKSVEKEIAELKKSNIHSSLNQYKQWLDENTKEKVFYYDFGKGKRRVHTAFSQSLRDEDLIREFTKKDLEFDGSKYNNADKLVYEFNRKLSNVFPTSKYYAYDKELYKTREYWATAAETIQRLRKGGKSFDCDDSMILRYSCLYYLLGDFFPESMWRLRGFIVDLWTGGGHAMLGWVKEGVNDWVPIETTYYDDKQGRMWAKDFTIHNQILYSIRYSFDHETEYVKT